MNILIDTGFTKTTKKQLKAHVTATVSSRSSNENRAAFLRVTRGARGAGMCVCALVVTLMGE